jgi:hypothetical protein
LIIQPKDRSTFEEAVDAFPHPEARYPQTGQMRAPGRADGWKPGPGVPSFTFGCWAHAGREKQMESARYRPATVPTIIRVLAIAIVVGASLTAIVLKTGEVDLAPCSIFTEFVPCGHRTDYRIPTRIGIVAIGVLLAVVLFRFARRLEESRTERRS